MGFSSKHMKNQLIAEINNSIFKLISPKKNLIIYSGSFSRGEETILEVNNNFIHLSDIEFTIFQDPLSYIFKKKHSIISQNIHDLGIKYNIKIDYDIKSVLTSSFIPKTFFWYETLQAKMFFGQSIFWNPPKINHSNIILGDIYEVLNHSMIAITKEIIGYKKSNTELNELKYRIIKSGADLFIPLLATKGIVIPTHSKRLTFIIENKKEIKINHELKSFAKVMREVKFPSSQKNLNISLDEISIDNALELYKNLVNKTYSLIQIKAASKIRNPYGFISTLRILHVAKQKLRFIPKLEFNFLFVNATKLAQINLTLLNKISDTGINEVNNDLLESNLIINKIIYRYLK